MKSQTSQPPALSQGVDRRPASSTSASSSASLPPADRRPLSQYILADEEREDVGWTIFDSANEDANGNLGKPRLDLSVLKRIKHFLNDETSKPDEDDAAFFDDGTSVAPLRNRVAYPFYDGNSSRSQQSAPQRSWPDFNETTETPSFVVQNDADSELIFDPRNRTERLADNLKEFNDSVDSLGDADENLKAPQTPEFNDSTVFVSNGTERETKFFESESDASAPEKRDESEPSEKQEEQKSAKETQESRPIASEVGTPTTDISTENADDEENRRKIVENVALSERVEPIASPESVATFDDFAPIEPSDLIPSNERIEAFEQTTASETKETSEAPTPNRTDAKVEEVESIVQNGSDEKKQKVWIDFSSEIAETETRRVDPEPENVVLPKKRTTDGVKKTKKNRPFGESSKNDDVARLVETPKTIKLEQLVETPQIVKELQEEANRKETFVPTSTRVATNTTARSVRESELVVASVGLRREKTRRPSRTNERSAGRRMTIFQRFVRLVSQTERATSEVLPNVPSVENSLVSAKCGEWSVEEERERLEKEHDFGKNADFEGRIRGVDSNDGAKNVELIVAPIFSESDPICSTFSTLESSFDFTSAAENRTKSEIKK